MRNFDHTLDTLRYANGVKIRNLDRGVLVTSVVEIKNIEKMHSLVICHPDDGILNFKKARRHLTFFVNSSFMDVPDAPSIRDIFSWNVMTPYYLENVTYT